MTKATEIWLKYKGELALLLVTMIWGATFAIVKEALSSVSTMLFISLRFLIAAAILFPFAMKRRKAFLSSAIRPAVILGVILFLGFATQTIGLKYTTATKSGFITGSVVVIVPLLQTLIEKRLPSKGSIIGVIIVFTGIIFLSGGGSSFFSLFEDLGSNFNVGDFFTILCAFFFALYIMLIDIYTAKYNFFLLLYTQLSVCGILGLIFALFLDVTSIEQLSISVNSYLIFAVLYTSLLASLLTTAMQTKFQKEVSPTKAGILYSFEPIFAAIIAYFALNEKITNFGFIGCLLIFVGLLFSEIYESKVKNHATAISEG